MSDFKLSKYYFDCITEDKNVFIGYLAELKYKGITLKYISSLNFNNHILYEKSKIRSKLQYPTTAGNIISWESSSLGIKGSWEGDRKAIKETLYDTEIGSLVWNCLQPKSKVTLSIAGKPVTGNGYVEHLTMTIKPWDLPFNKLKWGRFISETDSIIWIEWSGDHNETFLWYNNVLMKKVCITKEEVNFSENIKLEINENEVIREDDLYDSVIKKIPILNDIKALKFLRMNETKWIGNGTLYENGKQKSAGTIIHEIVTFEE